MESTKRNPFAGQMRTASASGLLPIGGPRAAIISRDSEAGELRRAALTLALALYPLVGSVTIVLAAIMVASGANGG